MVILSELQLLPYCPSPLHLYHSLFLFLFFNQYLVFIFPISSALAYYYYITLSDFFCVLSCEGFQSLWSSKLQFLNGHEFYLIA